MPAGVGYVSGDSSSAMKDGPGTIVVTVLVLLLWLFSVYRLYRVWAVKLNFSAPGVNNFYSTSLFVGMFWFCLKQYDVMLERILCLN